MEELLLSRHFADLLRRVTQNSPYRGSWLPLLELIYLEKGGQNTNFSRLNHKTWLNIISGFLKIISLPKTSAQWNILGKYNLTLFLSDILVGQFFWQEMLFLRAWADVSFSLLMIKYKVMLSWHETSTILRRPILCRLGIRWIMDIIFTSTCSSSSSSSYSIQISLQLFTGPILMQLHWSQSKWG